MGQHPRILRKRTDRLHAMGASWREQGNERRHFGKNRERSRHNHLSARAGVAIASISSDVADSRHVVAGAPRGKYGRAKNSVERRRMENDRHAGGTRVANINPAWVSKYRGSNARSGVLNSYAI